MGSYNDLVGAPLLVEGEGADWLHDHASFVLLAHNTDPVPRFIYANRAQACFEYPWDEFTTPPSRLSAEPSDHAEFR